MLSVKRKVSCQTNSISKQYPDKTELVILLVLVLLTTIALFCISRYVLQSFPNSADEHAYIFQAQVFAQGRLSAPEHPHQEFLSPFYILTHEGKVFSIFPPGWSLILSIGMFWGVPALVNPIIGGITVLVVFALGWILMGRKGAWISTALTVICPFFLFNGASYFSHPACLLCVMLAIVSLILWDRMEIGIYALLTGFFASLAFITREYTAILLLAIPIVGIARHSFNRKLFIAWFVIGASPFFMFYIYNNQSLTGNWLRPARFLLESERLGFGDRVIRVFDYIETQHYGLTDAIRNLLINCGRLFLWITPGAPLIALWGMWRKRNNKWFRYFAISAFLLPLGYMLYPSDGGNQYGPRFYYESVVFIILLATAGILSLEKSILKRKLLLYIVIVVLTANGFMLWKHGAFYAEQIYDRRALYRLVKRHDLHDAVVFVAVPSGDMTQGDLIRNLPDPADSDVVYAWHLGRRNKELSGSFIGRSFYLFSRDTRTGVLFLKRLSL